MAADLRDTMCAFCFRWTHRLTPGGNSRIFCDNLCENRYAIKHGTIVEWRLLGADEPLQSGDRIGDTERGLYVLPYEFGRRSTRHQPIYRPVRGQL